MIFQSYEEYCDHMFASGNSSIASPVGFLELSLESSGKSLADVVYRTTQLIYPLLEVHSGSLLVASIGAKARFDRSIQLGSDSLSAQYWANMFDLAMLWEHQTGVVEDRVIAIVSTMWEVALSEQKGHDANLHVVLFGEEEDGSRYITIADSRCSLLSPRSDGRRIG